MTPAQGRCLPSGEADTLGAITSALFLTAREGPRRTSPAAGAFVCLLVRGQAGGATVAVRIAGGATVAAGGATVAAAGGVTVDVRTAAAGGAAAARAPAAAVAPPARLRPAIARAARLVRTDISVSLDDEEEPRDPRRLFDFSTNYTYAKERVFKAVRRARICPGAGQKVRRHQ